MKYYARHYALALVSAWEGKKDAERKKILDQFVRMMIRHRVWGIRVGILEQVARYEAKKRGMRRVRVEKTDTHAKSLKDKLRKVLGKKIDYEERVNPDLIGGVRVFFPDDEILVDASVSTQLDRIFASKTV
ncbi:MAG: hypothetical protein G01um101466_392 [Parcubacteria group bacterium Gr01-1014_66]|nr:MAG: hypothetical protein G01um101466_392 [Parcubacteria group bacterium Gr01-1014_66]